MKRVCLTIGMALLIASLPLLAFARHEGVEGRRGHGPREPRRMHRGGYDGGVGHGVDMFLRLKKKLGLGTEQVKQLEAIKNEVQGKFKIGAEAVKAKRDALHKAVESGAAEAVIRAAAGEFGNAIGDQAVLRAATKAKVDAVLTGAQKTKLQELKKQRKEKVEQWRTKGEQKMGGGRKGRRGHGGSGGPESAFARFDTDGNGAISIEEFKAHMEKMKGHRGGKGPEGRRRPKSE